MNTHQQIAQLREQLHETATRLKLAESVCVMLVHACDPRTSASSVDETMRTALTVARQVVGGSGDE